MNDSIRRTLLRLRRVLPSGPGRHRAGTTTAPALAPALASAAMAAARVPSPHGWYDYRTVELQPFVPVRPYVLDPHGRRVLGGAR